MKNAIPAAIAGSDQNMTGCDRMRLGRVELDLLMKRKIAIRGKVTRSKVRRPNAVCRTRIQREARREKNTAMRLTIDGPNSGRCCDPIQSSESEGGAECRHFCEPSFAEDRRRVVGCRETSEL
jgi:hypothetical protein